jgi:hypothetical protein
MYNNSTPMNFIILTVALLGFSLKFKQSCLLCSQGLILLSIGTGIYAVYVYYKIQQWRKK